MLTEFPKLTELFVKYDNSFTKVTQDIPTTASTFTSSAEECKTCEKDAPYRQKIFTYEPSRHKTTETTSLSKKLARQKLLQGTATPVNASREQTKISFSGEILDECDQIVPRQQRQTTAQLSDSDSSLSLSSYDSISSSKSTLSFAESSIANDMLQQF